jgi:hypothetical protein
MKKLGLGITGVILLFCVLVSYKIVSYNNHMAQLQAFEKFETFVEGLDGYSDYIPINGLKIPIGCFEYMLDHGDNYEHYYESYTGNKANYEDDDFRSFIENIGNSMGSIVPVNDALYAWFLERTINLSPRIDQCDEYWQTTIH